MADKKEEQKYLGVTYLSVQSSEVTQDLTDLIAKFVMDLDKCRMLVYTNIQTGKPGCPPGGCQ
jgi:hypothetical protein